VKVTLLCTLLDILQDWSGVFAQDRTCRRAVAQALGTLTAFGRRTLSRVIWAQGHQDEDWSADYKLHARCRWRIADLFKPILGRALAWCRGRYVAVAIDDTRLRKTGRKIPTAAYGRDPMSPKFRINLMWGIRFVQISVLLPLYRQAKASPRAIPIRFEEAPPLKKPGRRASDDQWAEYRQARKEHNLSIQSVAMIGDVRTALDEQHVSHKTLLVVGDNSFCNRTLFTASWERIEIIARARRDIKLCRPAAAGSRSVYDVVKFTPVEVLADQQIPWQKARIFYAGHWRKISYKEVPGVLWQSGAKQRPLRLFVIEALPYYLPSQKRNHRRDPAFLLTTDLKGTARELLQPYFDRWQIEVNHREEKDTLGIGQAQLRSRQSVPRQPAFAVAAYSALMLAGLIAFGSGRGDQYQALPKWRRNANRPSCLDLVTLLRKEMDANKAVLEPFGFHIDWKSLGLAAAA
jgi:hypothetical protein